MLFYSTFVWYGYGWIVYKRRLDPVGLGSISASVLTTIGSTYYRYHRSIFRLLLDIFFRYNPVSRTSLSLLPGILHAHTHTLSVIRQSLFASYDFTTVPTISLNTITTDSNSIQFNPSSSPQNSRQHHGSYSPQRNQKNDLPSLTNLPARTTTTTTNHHHHH